MKGPLPDQKIVNAGGRRGTRHAGVRLVLSSTVCGTLVLFICLVAIFVVWYVNIGQTQGALASVSDEFRKMQADYLAAELANIIRPVWRTARVFVDNLETGVWMDHVQVIPPQSVTYNNLSQFESFSRETMPFINKEIFMTKAVDDVEEREYWDFVSTFIGIGLTADNTFAKNLQSCESAIFSINRLLGQEGLKDVRYNIDRQYYDESGFKRTQHGWDFDTHTIVPPTVDEEKDAAKCSDVMVGFDPPQRSSWENFLWHGPWDPNEGYGNHLEGNIPIYDEDRDQIGRIGVSVSLGVSVWPLLQKVILQGGAVTENGIAAVYSENGTVIGLSEYAAGGGRIHQPHSIYDITRDSNTRKALEFIMGEFGVLCPRSQHLLVFESEQRLIDISPFEASDWGIPNLPERWCQLLSVPRENLYGPIDKALITSVIVCVVAAVGFMLAVSLLFVSLCLVFRAQQSLKREKKMVDMQRVEAADRCTRALAAPMVLMSAPNFLAMETLEVYEDWRGRGKLVVIDNLEQEMARFKEENLIVFFSHEWLSWLLPDTYDLIQLKAMKRAVQHLMKTTQKRIYVWFDYVSVAQRHSGSKSMAVQSLPVYCGYANFFVIVAPDAKHENTKKLCSFATYARRGWCRAEMLSRILSCGLDNMYVMEGEAKAMEPMKPEVFSNVSLSVFEGEFTQAQDAERLLVPMLGLYSMILRRKNRAMVKHIKRYIDANKGRFFPSSYIVTDEGKVPVKRKLFGSLVSLLEEYVAKQDRRPEQTDVKHNPVAPQMQDKVYQYDVQTVCLPDQPDPKGILQNPQDASC
mmetsp:Transcript_46250/g.122689  ORF Transcript_46250/g.122689 Transcript_46250/m.122689 type:complete len:804 (-) Transcript_46250:206-2617(-)